MKHFFLLVFFTATVSLAQTHQTNQFEPRFKTSKKTTHKIAKEQDYDFGYLEVPENRTVLNGKTLKIPVYIFKSRNPDPQPDPIIYTVGGPGATTMPSAQYMNYYRYLDDRDFILVEQRGTRYAQPNLDCPEWSKAVYESNQPGFDETKTDEIFNKAAQKCKARLEAKGIDLNGYNTNEIAADINDLIKVLDIDSYNLLTISYSTKIAQVLLRDYPDKIRSVVMDSPLPLEVNYEEESVVNVLEAVSKLLEDCAAQESCQTAFPNLKERFYKFLIDLNQNPLELTIANPKTGEPEMFKLTGKDLITVFTNASTGDVSDIPFEILKLLEGNLDTVKEQLSYLFEGPGSGDGMGMRLSVWCSEEYPFVDQSLVESETYGHPEVYGLSPAFIPPGVCNTWGVKPKPEVENQPVKSTVPVLFINGEYDNETPPKWAKMMANNIPNSYHLIFKGWKHTPTTNWGNPCAMIAANDFFNYPNRPPDPDCLDEISTPQFKLD